MNKKPKNWKKIVGIVGAIVLIAGAGGAIAYTMIKGSTTTGDGANGVAEMTTNIDNGTITLSEGENFIKNAGTYRVTGSVSNGYIHINTNDEKAEVKLILDNVSITNSGGPAIYVESNGNTYIELVGENTINATTNDTLKGAIHSKADLRLSGDGTITIKSSLHGIVCKDDLQIDSGTYNITAGEDGIDTNDSAKINGGAFKISASSGDGIHTDGYLEISDGSIEITASEGLEGTYIKINGGKISISASDDGINAANKSTDYTVTVEINGGDIMVKMGAGDTDAIDSNGNIYINGGTINITAQSPFDYDGEAKYTGGTMIVNGTETTTITNQFMGGGGGAMPQGGQSGGTRRMMR